ncbi:1,25-dihydroxyvitamin D(3) 24-hydroxylase, mitochondrial-like [Rhopilema esculentum]|uniref:1,25-dihydroxyvitamin D(3) 24-hydroxylase, mitochondrial-like n=1 Tax=Rhopilema esculentum TaxID=499914 RepID=UPI0031E02903|eukprot:gene12774-3507_t
MINIRYFRKPVLITKWSNWQVAGLAKRQITVLSQTTDTKDLRDFDLLPGPKLWPILGNLEHVKNGGKLSHEVQLAMARKYGPVCKDSLLGLRTVIISDPTIGEEIYRAEGKYPFRDFSYALGEFFEERKNLGLQPSIIELNGEEWAALRKMLSGPMMKPINVKGFYPAFSSVALDAIDSINTIKGQDGIIQDFRESVLGKWSLETIGMFVYGMRMGLLDKDMTEVSHTFYEAIKVALVKSAYFSSNKMLKYLYRSDYKHLKASILNWYKSANHYMEKFMDQVKRSQSSGEPLDPLISSSLMSYMMFKRNLDPNECATHAVEMFGAGYDTTSISITWILYWLGRNQDKQEILLQELNEKVPDDCMLTDRIIQKMPYLRACIKESARLTPLAFVSTRIFEEDIVLQNYIVPANTPLMISNYAMGRDEKIYPNATTFLPERWLREKEDKSEINPFATLPFGFGSRSCLGRRIAEAEMQAFTALLIKRFRVEHIGEEQLGEIALGLKPLEDTKFAFHDR